MIDELRGFYSKHGDNYDVFLRRLMGKEALVKKYLQLFLSDSTYEKLNDAINCEDYDRILSEAHTLKGLTLNINLTILSKCAADIVSSLREGRKEDINELFLQLQEEYEAIVSELEA